MNPTTKATIEFVINKYKLREEHDTAGDLIDALKKDGKGTAVQHLTEAMAAKDYLSRSTLINNFLRDIEDVIPVEELANEVRSWAGKETIASHVSPKPATGSTAFSIELEQARKESIRLRSDLVEAQNMISELAAESVGLNTTIELQADTIKRIDKEIST